MKKIFGIIPAILTVLLFTTELRAGLAFDFSPALIDLRHNPTIYSVDFSPEYAMFVAGGKDGFFISYNGLTWQNLTFDDRTVSETLFIGNDIYIGTRFTKERRHWKSGWRNLWKNIRPYLYRKRFRGALFRVPVADLSHARPVSYARTTFFDIKICDTDYFGMPFFGRVEVDNVLVLDGNLFVSALSLSGKKSKSYITRGNFYKYETRKLDTPGKILDINSFAGSPVFSGVPPKDFREDTLGNISGFGFDTEGEALFLPISATEDTIMTTRKIGPDFYVAGRDSSGRLIVSKASNDYSGGGYFDPVLILPDTSCIPVEMEASSDYLLLLTRFNKIFYCNLDNDKIWYEAEVSGLESKGVNHEFEIVNDMLFIACKYGVYTGGLRYVKNDNRPVENLAYPDPLESELAGKREYEKDIPIVSVRPNPTDKEITIGLSVYKASVYNMKIYDVTDKKYEVFADKFLEKGEYIMKFPKTSLAPGRYNIKIESPLLSNHYSFTVNP